MGKTKIYIGDKLTEEAKNVAKMLQIDTSYLRPRNLDSFKEKGLAPEIQKIRYEHYEDRRNQLTWQIENAMAAMKDPSPTHQAILTNSVSKYLDAFPKQQSVMSEKPDIALRVPIDRDQMIQKVKAKFIYNEEKMQTIKENKEKLELMEQKRKELADKKMQDKANVKQQILNDSNKQRKMYFDKLEAKRRQAIENAELQAKQIEKENKKRHRSINHKLEEAQRRKEEEDRKRMGVTFQSNKPHGVSHRYSSKKHKKTLDFEDDVDQKMKSYMEKMSKAEELKQIKISEKLSKTMNHLEKVEERKHRHLESSVPTQIETIRSLTQKYKRMNDREKSLEQQRQRLRQEREAKEMRAYNNLLNQKREENQRKKYLKEKLKEKAEIGDKGKSNVEYENEQRKEIMRLKQKDHHDILMREQNLHKIYKQRLIEKLLEKKERANSQIKEQQNRISNLFSKRDQLKI